MSKYIDAEKIKQTFCAECNHTIKCEDCDIDYHFRHAPTADVQEVRHGRWIPNDNGTYSCSLCQSWIPNEQHHYARYCLYCGASMMDEVEE